jgi:predicted transcriptional regulator
LPNEKGRGKPHPRDRARIFYDILSSIVKQEKSADGARITRIQYEANLPSDRLRLHLREMDGLGLISYGDAVASTEKGRAFLSKYKTVVDVLNSFGLL